MDEKREFFIVSVDPRDAPLRDHLLHGYETRRDFYDALRALSDRWRNRVGERIGERHGFLLLRFHDTPGGVPDEEWLPGYLLKPHEVAAEVREPEEEASDQAYGFD